MEFQFIVVESKKSIMIRKHSIILFGGLPSKNQVGGVMSFIFNLAQKYNQLIDVVIDFYPGKNKRLPTNVNTIELKGNIFFRLGKLFLLQFKSYAIYHYNFSSTKGVLLLALFPKLKGSKWILMLHNGDQQSIYDKFPLWQRIIINQVLKRFDAIGIISNKQSDFFDSLSLVPKLFFRARPFIPSVGFNKDLKNSPSNTIRFLVSGYPAHIYRHLEVLEVFHDLEKSHHDFHLDICLYGSDSDNIHSIIMGKIQSLRNATVYQHIDSKSFFKILTSSDLYVRMNAVDSFGLVVAEAIEVGVEVVATDVCERYPGAYLLHKDDFSGLKKSLIYFLNNGSLKGYLPQWEERAKTMDFDELYKNVAEL